jgi:hypothetical protein
MKDGPEFPSDLADHLPARPNETSDRLSDRIRLAWLAYLTAVVVVSIWVTALIVGIVNGTLLALLVVIAQVPL